MISQAEGDRDPRKLRVVSLITMNAKLSVLAAMMWL